MINEVCLPSIRCVCQAVSEVCCRPGGRDALQTLSLSTCGNERPHPVTTPGAVLGEGAIINCPVAKTSIYFRYKQINTNQPTGQPRISPSRNKPLPRAQLFIPSSGSHIYLVNITNSNGGDQIYEGLERLPACGALLRSRMRWTSSTFRGIMQRTRK